MDQQTLFNAGFSAFMILLGWFMNSLKETMRSLQHSDEVLATKVQAIELLVAGSYVKKDELATHMNAIFAKLDKIDAKLDNKADKNMCLSIHKASES